MPKIEIDKELCKACELCLDVCPRQLIRISAGKNSMGAHYAEQTSSESCTGCRLCAIECPDIAISVFK